MYEELPSWRASELVARGAQLIDVREHDEIATGTHPDAVALPLSELDRRVHELRRDRPVALLCRSGNRSRDAAERLSARGFRHLVNLAGGVEALRR
ncbi:MAG: rhodanese-like domain-containing protein [Acidimicrobiales bacterium]